MTGVPAEIGGPPLETKSMRAIPEATKRSLTSLLRVIHHVCISMAFQGGRRRTGPHLSSSGGLREIVARWCVCTGSSHYGVTPFAGHYRDCKLWGTRGRLSAFSLLHLLTARHKLHVSA
jgi:hypothetical protein